MAVPMALVALCCLVVVQVGTALVQRARAATVAEATALAAVTAGDAQARQLAHGQGAAVVHTTDDGITVGVTVRLGGATATAHARRATVVPATADPTGP
ncbi:MAG: hypothetical protein ACKOFF_07640 [Acidimicrobiales bacterium]